MREQEAPLWPLGSELSGPEVDVLPTRDGARSTGLGVGVNLDARKIVLKASPEGRSKTRIQRRARFRCGSGWRWKRIAGGEPRRMIGLALEKP